MDVGGWLRGLGLGQYEEKFRDNKIDADLLPRLTVDDLKDIGVSVVGDRRRLLDAIAVRAGAGPASPTKSAPSKGLQASAERRPITVMFCDLVGSTSLAAKLDAEDWRNLVNTYLAEASKAVTDFGGHVLKKLGDGLMALFGYPQAQESRRPYSSRSLPTSIGSALRARSRRSALFLAESSLTRCYATLRRPTKQRWSHPWMGSLRPTSCLSRARRQMPTIASSTR
jgi:class 3 adenylate cyclase